MKKILIIFSLFLCMAFLFTGCGGSPKPTNTVSDTAEDKGGETEENTETEEGTETEEDTETEETEEEIVAEEESEDEDLGEEESSDEIAIDGSAKFKSISDLSNYWNTIYTSNEAVLNAYEGMPIMELVTPGLCFVSGVQYDLLNMEDVDGRFDGELMFAGFQGFVEKSGAQLTFGYEDELEEDGFAPSMKKGDKKVENGNCDLEKGYYFTDSYTEREGAIIERSTSEFKMQENGSMCVLVMEGRSLNYRNEEESATSYIFIRGGKDQYDFVVARTELGTDFEVLTLEAEMTKEKAIAMFEAAGATIEKTGGIVNGTLVLEE